MPLPPRPAAGRPSARRRRLALLAASALAAILVTPAAANARAGDWLSEINLYRSASGLASVTEQPAWSTGLQHHLTYLANTPASYRTGTYASAHTENPASPYYTADGAAAGASSDLAEGVGSALDAVDGWFAAPFHAIGMLRPGLTQVALAFDAGNREAGLDVIRGVGSWAPPAAPVLFPGPGMTTDLTTYFGGESPSPLETCGWNDGSPRGLPVIALLPSAPTADLSATLVSAGGPSYGSADGSLCVVDANTFTTTDGVYGPTGRTILQNDHAVLLIAPAPLAAGTWNATIHQGGQPDVAWSFTTGDAPAAATGTPAATGPAPAPAAAASAPAGPRRLGYRRVAGLVTVTWSPVAGALRYRVALTAGGRTRTVTARGTRARFRLPALRAATVRVKAVLSGAATSRPSAPLRVRALTR